jgi:glycosyltransferase involved in cell wall biosynthesis
VYEYLRLKKPILAVVPQDGEAARLIIDTGAGIICHDNDPDKIAAALQQLAAKHNEYGFTHIEQFERSVLAGKLNKFMEEIGG